MTNQKIVLPRTLAQKLLAHAQSSPDANVCGIISAKDSNPINAYPISNIAKQPARDFAMNDDDVTQTIKLLSSRGEKPFAVYHSHPAEPPIPTADDIASDKYPEMLYFIVSLNTKGVLEMRGWKLENGEARALELKI